MIDLRRWTEQLTEIRTTLEAASRGCLLVVATTDAALEQDLAGVLAEVLDGRVGQYTFDAAYPSLAAYLETMPLDGPRVVLACGLDNLPSEARARALRHLNRERETLARSGRSVVLFIRLQTVQDLAFQAGDFWSWRSGLYEFEAPPDEPARQEALAALRLSLPASLEALRRRYLDYIVAAYRWLDLRGLMQVRNLVRLPLKQVYIPLSATEEVEEEIPLPPDREQSPGPLDQAALPPSSRPEKGARKGDRMDSPDQRESFRIEKVTRRTSLAQALREYRQMVVLGDPGSGKSTFLRYVALACAEGPQAAREQLGLDDAPLPILVPLAAYVLELKKLQHQENLPSLAEFLPRYFQGLGLPDLAPLFDHCLEMGRAILLLDGLDEVTSIRERQTVAQAVEALAASYPRCRFVVTSRIAGYDAAPLSRNFARLTVAPLEAEDIRRFAHQWSLAYEAAGAEPEMLPPEIRQRADVRAEDLYTAVTSHPAIEKLAVNPLLLTILALIHYQGTRLPHRRVELYRLCVEALAETWNLARSLSGRPVDLWLGDRRLDERTVVRILAPVAFWMHQERPGGLVSREELISLLTTTPYRLAPELASDFVDLAREQMGLLVERGQGQFGFIHPAFQEYLAARYAAMQVDPFMALSPYLRDPRWEEVVRLTAGILSDFSRTHTTRFVQAILKARHLHLALRILADNVAVEEELAREVLTHAVYVMRFSSAKREEMASGLGALGKGPYESLALSSLLSVLQCRDVDAQRETRLYDTCYSWISLSQKEQDAVEARRAAVVALGKLGTATDEVLLALWATSQDENSRVQEAAAEALGHLAGISDQALTMLLETLESENPGMRQAAVRALRNLNSASDRALAALLSTLRDGNPDAREAAAEALGKLGKATDEVLTALLSALRDENTGVRQAAAKALGSLKRPTEEVVDALVAALRDKSKYVRRAAAKALGNLNQTTDKVLAALQDALRDRHVKEAALGALIALSRVSDKAVAAFLAALLNGNEDMREAAAKALGVLGKATDEIVDALLTALRDEEASVREAAAEALGNLSRPTSEVLAALKNALQDSEVRLAAVRALGRLGQATDDVLAALLDALRDKSFSVREASVEALVNLDRATDEVLAALLFVLKNDEFGFIREAAIEALSNLGRATDEVIAALSDALRSDNEESESVRAAAIQALVKLGRNSDEVLPPLLVALRDKSDYVRREAVKALGNINLTRDKARNALRAALRDKDWMVRQAAKEVLEKMKQT